MMTSKQYIAQIKQEAESAAEAMIRKLLNENQDQTSTQERVSELVNELNQLEVRRAEIRQLVYDLGWVLDRLDHGSSTAVYKAKYEGVLENLENSLWTGESLLSFKEVIERIKKEVKNNV